MLKEIVRRRYSRLVREKSALPQLVLIDGGKAHLFAAAAEIEKLGLRLDIAAIAKQRENIYILGRKTPLRPRRDSAALNIIRRIRDEAHRFALKYHCLLRRKKIIGESARLSSGGIGGYEEKKRALKKSKNMQSSLITVIKK
jgi:excinuclease ABC subunit C